VYVVVHDGEGRTKCALDGPLLTEYEYPLEEKLLYARVMIEDEQGGKAWSQPIFIDELLDEPEFAMDSTVVK